MTICWSTKTAVAFRCVMFAPIYVALAESWTDMYVSFIGLRLTKTSLTLIYIICKILRRMKDIQNFSHIFALNSRFNNVVITHNEFSCGSSGARQTCKVLKSDWHAHTHARTHLYIHTHVHTVFKSDWHAHTHAHTYMYTHTRTHGLQE